MIIPTYKLYGLYMAGKAMNHPPHTPFPSAHHILSQRPDCETHTVGCLPSSLWCLPSTFLISSPFRDQRAFPQCLVLSCSVTVRKGSLNIH